MSTDDEHPRPRPTATASAVPHRRARVEESVNRVAAERGIDFTPIPEALAAVAPELTDAVEQLAAGMNERERQWLAVVLAALADQVQRASLPDAHRNAPSGT